LFSSLDGNNHYSQLAVNIGPPTWSSKDFSADFTKRGVRQPCMSQEPVVGPKCRKTEVTVIKYQAKKTKPS
jgi:hypothetical protein